MHKLLEYVCDELEELERKADKNGKLSMQEIQYVDTLAHTKKNLMKAEEMAGEGMSMESGYSGASYSYARGGRGGNSNRGGNSSRGYSGEYSGESMNSGRSGSYGRSGNGGSYTRGGSGEDPREELAVSLKELKMDAKDPETERMITRWIKQLEQD